MTRNIVITHPVNAGTYLLVELLRDQPPDVTLEAGLIVQNYLAIRSRKRRELLFKTAQRFRDLDSREGSSR